MKKSDRTRADILSAARRLFGERGYEGTTIRDIAGSASIDPAMVIRYFGSKDALFAQAATIELNLPALRDVSPEAVGEALIRRFLDVWEGAQGASMIVLLRSATSNEYAADKAREVFASQVRPAIAAIADPAEASRRAGLVSSQLLGLALSRYVLRLPPVVGLSRDEIVQWIGPTIQRYITGTQP